MRKKMSALILVLVFILAALSGCMELERGIRVKANGDVECYTSVYMSESDMKYIYNTPEKFYEALQDSIDEDYPTDSFEKIQKEDGSTTWYGAMATYKIDKSDVEDDIGKVFSNYDIEYKTSGFLFKKVSVTIESDGKSLITMFSDLIKDPEKELSSYFNQTKVNEFAISVPYPIVSTNGAKKSDAKNTVVWNMKNLDSNGGGELTMEVSYLNLPVFIILLAVILIIIIVIIVLLVRRSRKKKKAALLAQGAQVPLQQQQVQPAAPQTPAQAVPQAQAPQTAAPQVKQVQQPAAPQRPVEPQMPAPPVMPQVPAQAMGDVPQVTGLPMVGQLPKSESVDSDKP